MRWRSLARSLLGTSERTLGSRSARDREINQDLFFCPPRRGVWRPGPRSGSRGGERQTEKDRQEETEKEGRRDERAWERDEGLSVVEGGKSRKGSCGCESVLSRGETINFAGIHVDRREDEPTSTIDGLCWPTVSRRHPLAPTGATPYCAPRFTPAASTALLSLSSLSLSHSLPRSAAERRSIQTPTNLIQ